MSKPRKTRRRKRNKQNAAWKPLRKVFTLHAPKGTKLRLDGWPTIAREGDDLDE
jgi:hypothetical protein